MKKTNQEELGPCERCGDAPATTGYIVLALCEWCLGEIEAGR